MAKFIAMVGIAGSGKSTIVAKLAKEYEAVVCSSDAIRGELYGDESIQGDFQYVYKLMEERAKEALEAGRNVIYDATNVTAWRRRQILAWLPQGVEKECVWVNVPIEKALQNNLKRDRHVPEWVVRQHAKQLEPPTLTEGWNHIRVVEWPQH